jgi:hypothetical protein
VLSHEEKDVFLTLSHLTQLAARLEDRRRVAPPALREQPTIRRSHPMPSTLLDDSFIPDQPTHPQGAEFFAQVTGMLDGKSKDPAKVEAALAGWDELIEHIAAELYRIGSMLLGEGEETIGIIEQVVTHADISACEDHVAARHSSRLLLAAEAIGVLHDRDASALAAPEAGDSGPASCIEDDELDAAGVSAAELEAMLTGPDNHRLRNWLEGLAVSQRVIFVLRGVAVLNSAEVAGLLGEHGGPAAQDWTPDAVRSGFRQALCSLASQLLHASNTR